MDDLTSHLKDTARAMGQAQLEQVCDNCGLGASDVLPVDINGCCDGIPSDPNDEFFISSKPGDCICLYCERVTSVRPTRTRFAVCSWCRGHARRDERREVQVGMRPWVVEFADGRMPQAEREAAQLRWDAWQFAVRQFNAAACGKAKG